MPAPKRWHVRTRWSRRHANSAVAVPSMHACIDLSVIHRGASRRTPFTSPGPLASRAMYVCHVCHVFSAVHAHALLSVCSAARSLPTFHFRATLSAGARTPGIRREPTFVRMALAFREEAIGRHMFDSCRGYHPATMHAHTCTRIAALNMSEPNVSCQPPCLPHATSHVKPSVEGLRPESGHACDPGLPDPFRKT